jgi:Zn-dependent protease
MFISQLLSNPFIAVLYLLAIVVAVSIHEYAHALAADRLGDPTPRLQGRLTLNPRAHLDLYGSLLFLLVGFGWGKPVQFDPFNLRNPRRDAAVISLAGPLSNFILAALASALLHALTPFLSIPLISPFLVLLIQVNIMLGVFNLVPIHPLDGFKIVGGILPQESARQWYELERYGMIFLIILLLPLSGGVSPISQLIRPPIQFLLNILLPQTPIV